MNRVTKYIIAFGRTGPELEQDVADRIAEGFQPMGGPCHAKDGVLLQAMVKYEVRHNSKYD
ncbi:MAG TPA: hypothetical protein VHB20_07070 [Verrucomicrobiae bacterium]|jgi:hypothetical protein|nr:hypothetical protein [Verrucomicrobiae bacterium]